MKKKLHEIRIGSSACYYITNPRGGFVNSHRAECSATVTVKGIEGRPVCNEVAALHARVNGWCGNVCQACGTRMQESDGASLGEIATALPSLPTATPIRARELVVTPSAKPSSAEAAASTPAAGSAPAAGYGIESKPQTAVSTSAAQRSRRLLCRAKTVLDREKVVAAPASRRYNLRKFRRKLTPSSL